MMIKRFEGILRSVAKRSCCRVGALLTPVVILFICDPVSTVFAQTLPEAAGNELRARLQISEAWLDVRSRTDDIPSISAAIVHDQNTLWQYVTGAPWYDNYGNSKDKSAPAFRICSISKLFTAISIMQLVETGEVRLDGSVAHYLPFLEQLQGKHDFKGPDVRSVLTHTAGLPSEAPIPYFVEINYPTPAEFIDAAQQVSLKDPPYSHYRYSNLGYALLGEIVSEVSGKSFDKYVRDRILDPLGLDQTSVDASKRPFSRLTPGCTIRNKEGLRVPFDHYSFNAISPAGGFISTSDDLATFAAWMFRTLDGDGGGVLEADTLREMQRVQWSEIDRSGCRRGLGFGYYDHAGRTFVGHGGYCNGYRSVLMTDPVSKIAIIVMINVNDASPYDIAYQLYDLVVSAITRPAAELERNAPYRAFETDLQAFTGTYDRPGMPERVVITSNGRELLVADLFGDSSTIERLQRVAETDFRISSGMRAGDAVTFEKDIENGT